MRALVVSPDPSERPALVGTRLLHHGVTLDQFVVCDDAAEPQRHQPFPPVDGYDLVVAMGAPWSVYDTATIGNWIGQLLDLLREAVRRDMPVLGICFGAQALSAALGGTVELAPVGEAGWSFVDTDEIDLVAPGPWFQWHADRFTVPPRGVEVARSAVAVQAFRYGRSLGVQFHPEVDAALATDWLAGTEPDGLFRALGVEPDEVVARTAEVEEVATANAFRLVDRFLSAGSGSAG